MVTRLLRYGAVGASAAAIYFALAVGLIELVGMGPLSANPLAFLVAFLTNYSGQRFLTFPETTRPHTSSLPRFLIVALLGFSLNQGLLFTLLDRTSLGYQLALPAAAAGATSVTFLLSLLWAFRVPTRVVRT